MMGATGSTTGGTAGVGDTAGGVGDGAGVAGSGLSISAAERIDQTSCIIITVAYFGEIAVACLAAICNCGFGSNQVETIHSLTHSPLLLVNYPLHSDGFLLAVQVTDT